MALWSWQADDNIIGFVKNNTLVAPSQIPVAATPALVAPETDVVMEVVQAAPRDPTTAAPAGIPALASKPAARPAAPVDGEVRVVLGLEKFRIIHECHRIKGLQNCRFLPHCVAKNYQGISMLPLGFKCCRFL